MEFKRNIIKLTTLILCITVLCIFSEYRSKHKTIQNLQVEFVGEESVYTTESSVNKLLIQNFGRLENLSKDKVVLNAIEKVLRADDMVKDAQVFLTINGELTTKIVQRKPLARIEDSIRSYLDDEGRLMPFSRHHSARVPIITGKITGKSLEDVYEILKYVNADDFLRKNVIGIHIKEENDYQLKFRIDSFVVNLGGIENMEKKFNNLKAFYAKANKDKSLGNYAIVSLEFDNQVVCTKI